MPNVVGKATSIGPGLIEELFARILGQAADTILRDRLVRILRQAALAGSREVAEALGLRPTVDAGHPGLARLVSDRLPKIVGINDTTRAAVRKALLAVAVDGGSLEDQQRAVRNVFSSASRGRAQTISRTETSTFWHSAGNIQAVDLGARSHIWISTRDARVRDEHAAAEGQCQPINHPFIVGGESLAYPVDPNGSPWNIINCYLPGTPVLGSFVAGIRSSYSGPARHIVTRRGHRLSVTPNHPILTTCGFVPAGKLCVGDDLFSDRVEVSTAPFDQFQHDKQQQPAVVEEVFESIRVRGTALRNHLAPDDLHGDARFVEGEVDVVRTDGLLSGAAIAAADQRGLDFSLVEEAMRPARLSRQGALAALFEGDYPPAHRFPGLPGLALDPESVALHRLPLERFGSGVIANWLTERAEFSQELWTGNASALGELLHGDAAPILLDEIVEVRDDEFRGHVYDLQTHSGLMMAGGIVCSNCRCTESYQPTNCDARALTHAQRSAIWKQRIHALTGWERVTLATTVMTFQEQRDGLLAALDQLRGG